MMHRAARAIPALALVLAAGTALGGCATATAGASSASTAPSGSTAPSAASSSAAGASAPVVGPVADPACAAALKARQVLEARQGKDQSSQSAIDQDFTNFANALNAAAGQEKNPATAKAMSDLANDYTALVQSQSGAQQLPDMSQVQSDGAAFDKACGLSLAPLNAYRPSRAAHRPPGSR
jgi:hypothetical protein